MSLNDFINLIKKIVEEANLLKNKYTTETYAPVNYACIFCHSDDEYIEFRQLASNLGNIIEETHSGPLFRIKPLQTVDGKLQLLKIRIFDSEHLDLGDADFTVSDYSSFKKTYLNKSGFKLIERPEMEMMELMDQKFNSRAYFSNPPLDKQFEAKLQEI